MSKLAQAGANAVMFRCPGCGEAHTLNIGAPPTTWSFNGNVEAPTFRPSVLARSGHHAPHYDGGGCWCDYNREHPDEPDKFECYVCHSFVTDGRIQFLADCTHALAGQTVDLPDWSAT